MAGRLTPRIRPMRSRALAMVAPVLPALTIAEARPSRTASAARTSDESFLRRTPLAGSSSMAMTSDAGRMSRPPVSTVASTSGWPTSTTGIPCSRDACTAPATISSGALSPPMASTATGSMAAQAIAAQAAADQSVDVYGLAAAVPAAVLADHVRELGLAALGADRASGRFERPVRRTAAAALGLGGLLLGDGHRRLSSVVSVVVGAQRIQHRPPRVHRHSGVAAVTLVAVGPAFGAEALAVLRAEGRQGQLEQYSVARQRRQVDLVAMQRIGLLAVAALLVELAGVRVDLAGDSAQAAPALPDP